MKTPLDMGIEKPYIDKPLLGWLEKQWYVVEVAFSPGNPVHRALLYTGFLHNGEPSSYAKDVAGSYESDYCNVYYLKSIRCLIEMNVKP